MKRRLLPILVAAAAGSLLTAGALTLPALADGDDESADMVFPSRERVERFEQCMRDAGFDFGDNTRVLITPDGVTVNGERVDAEKFHAAQRECGPPFPALREGFRRGELPPLPDGERLERLRECLERETT